MNPKENQALVIIGLLLVIVIVVLVIAWLAQRFDKKAPNPAVPGDWPAAETYGRTGEFSVLLDNRSIDQQAADIQEKINEIKGRLLS